MDGLVLIATNAFGNAIGASLAAQSDGGSQQLAALQDRQVSPIGDRIIVADTGVSDAAPIYAGLMTTEGPGLIRTDGSVIPSEYDPGYKAYALQPTEVVGKREEPTLSGYHTTYTGSYIPENAPEGYEPPVIGDFDPARNSDSGPASSGNLQPIGPLNGLLTFSPGGRMLKGAGHSVVNAVTAVPRVFVEAVKSVGDLGGYVASAAPWRPTYQPHSALFRTLKQDGPLPIVGSVVQGFVSPLKQLYEGGMYGRYESLGEGGVAIAGAALGLRYKVAGGVADAGMGWTAPKNWQGPSLTKGSWTGTVGNSEFALTEAAARAAGVPLGSKIRFMEGTPDFGPYTVPTPAGTSGSFSVRGLVYEHGADARATINHLATEAGMTPAQVRKWLAVNEVRMHHFRGDAIQLVPTPLHTGVHHTGSRGLSGQ